jgi:hypothetical protein
MSEETIKASGDLIRWLKMLALPAWARWLLALMMVLVLGSALSLLVWGVVTNHIEVVSSAVAILTVGLPIGLIVVALVFGDGGAHKLKNLTQLVLEQEVPEALRQNLASTTGYASYRACHVAFSVSGCIADYTLTVEPEAFPAETRKRPQLSIEFKLELNVRKANLVVWLPALAVASSADRNPYQSCFFGAKSEGYLQNDVPIAGERSDQLGVVFIKLLGEDFLLNPGERLYFAQDLAFFIRGLLSVELQYD